MSCYCAYSYCLVRKSSQEDLEDLGTLHQYLFEG